MGSKIAHIVYTPFTGLGDFNPDNKWFLNRIRIFKQFTQQSLLKQGRSVLDFLNPLALPKIKSYLHLVSFRKEDAQNPLIGSFATDLDFIPLFSGLLYYDDRFSERSEKNRRIADRLDCLKELESRCKDADWIYFTKLDSDDMFHREAFEEIMKQKPQEKTAFIFQNGYIYNKNTDEMAEWNPTTCPPFYTICFPKDVFFDGKKHAEYMKGWKSHEDTVKIFKPVYLSDRKYCVLVHGKNTTTSWNHRFKGKTVDSQLLSNFI